MIDELYIDGNRMDMGAESGIYLTYRSNIFSDVSKIVGNNSGTIKLPLTANNKAIIKCSFLPSADTNFPYKNHSARLIRDGIVIIDNATAVLMEVTTEEIQIALTWGVSANLQSFIGDSNTLQDLSESGELKYLPDITWKKNSDIKLSYQQPTAYYGFRKDETEAAYHPVVEVQMVLQAIAHSNGIIFNWDITPWFVNTIDRTNGWVIPCLTRNGEGNTESYQPQSDYSNYKLVDDKYFLCKIRSNPYATTDEGNYITWVNDDHSTTKVNNVSIKLGSGSIMCVCTKPDDWPFDTLLRCEFGICSYNEDDGVDVKESTFATNVDVNSDGNHCIYFDWDFDNMDAAKFEDAGTDIYFCIIKPSTMALGIGDIYLSYAITMYDYQDPVAVGDNYPIVTNLPDIKQIDFVKGIAQMTGQFAFLGDDDSTIEFCTFNTLIENKSNAQDWSAYYVGKDIPNQIDYTQGDECQRNNMLYKDGDETSANFDSFYEVSNETLDEERDAITLPFTTYGKRGRYAGFPMYSYNDDNELEYNEDDNPYICEMVWDGEEYYLTPEGIKWGTLIPTYWQDYVSMLNNAKVLTETFMLTPLILKAIDMRIPIYLNQYNAYFAIIEIKTKANNMAEVKLIKL